MFGVAITPMLPDYDFDFLNSAQRRRCGVAIFRRDAADIVCLGAPVLPVTLAQRTSELLR